MSRVRYNDFENHVQSYDLTQFKKQKYKSGLRGFVGGFTDGEYACAQPAPLRAPDPMDLHI